MTPEDKQWLEERLRRLEVRVMAASATRIQIAAKLLVRLDQARGMKLEVELAERIYLTQLESLAEENARSAADALPPLPDAPAQGNGSKS